MADGKQKQSDSSYLFDLVEANLPRQENDDEDSPLSITGFILWMLGITAAFFIINLAYVFLF